jgi:hypothetical protein
MTHFFGLSYIFVESDAVAEFIGFFHIFVGYATGALAENK